MSAWDFARLVHLAFGCATGLGFADWRWVSMSFGQEINRWAAAQRSTDSQPHGRLEPLFGIKAREAFRIDHDGGQAGVSICGAAAVERKQPAG